MPVPLGKIRKRASNVQRSCNQILLAETQGATVGLPGACRFYNVGGLYGVGAKSRFVRRAIKTRTQLCCNCEGNNKIVPSILLDISYTYCPLPPVIVL